MNIPGFTAEASLFNVSTRYQATTETAVYSGLAEEQSVVLAAGPGPACVWWQRWFFPVACNFIDFNIAMGLPGYGPGKCTAWQIPFDPVGCAAL